MKKSIVILGAFEPKRNEVEYIKEQIEKRGHKTILIGLDKRLDEVKKIVNDLFSSEKLDGIISLGGPTGTEIGIKTMKTLPIGLPKIMVTTVRDACYVGTNDITVMPISRETLSLKVELRKILSNAAGAIAGMVEAETPEPVKPLPLIGITALGVTTPAVMKIISLLKKRGYDAISFHARTEMLNKLIEEGRVAGVIDLTPCEVLLPFAYHMPDEFLGIKDRLEVAGEKGLPQVTAPGGLDMLIFLGTKESVPEEFQNRPLHAHGPNTVLVRTTEEEVREAGRTLVGRANRASGPVAIVIPLRGFSADDEEGKHFYDPIADRAFAEVVKENAQEKVYVVEVDAHINDDKFAEEVVDIFDKMYISSSRLKTKGGDVTRQSVSQGNKF